jgi:hypothetical protein
MLKEFQAGPLRYDAASDVAVLEISGAVDAGAGTTPRQVSGQLLLDTSGFLVGIDLGGDGPTVVMLGPHEKVDRTQPAQLTVTFDGSGQPAEVRVAKAKSALRGDEASPYTR